MKRIGIFFFCLVFFSRVSFPQDLDMEFDFGETLSENIYEPELAKKVFDLMNHARVQPLDFLEKYGDKIEEKYPILVTTLQSAPPLDSLKWDDGAAKMAKEIAIGATLNPEKQFVFKNCGSLGSQGSSRPANNDPFKYFRALYKNINDPGYAYFGMYFHDGNTEYAYFFCSTCDQKQYSYQFNGIIDSSTVKQKKINTASEISYLTQAEQQMIYEINFVRYYPTVYAQIIQKYLKDNSPMNNDEYKAGIELIEELNAAKPLSILVPEKCLFETAQFHRRDCESRKFTDHEGSDGRMPNDRVLSFCSKLKAGSENLVSGYESPRDANIALLLDAGISGRGHRKNVLNKDWKYISSSFYINLEMFGDYHYIQQFGN